MKLTLVLAIVALFTISGLSVSASGSGEASGLVFAKCASCHSLKRVCRKIGKKDLAAWKKTNQRMADMGMTITAEELDMISSYLTTAKPDDSPVCK